MPVGYKSTRLVALKRLLQRGGVAQLVRAADHNPRVGGSSPSSATITRSSKLVPFQQPLDEGAQSTTSESIEALLLDGANIVTTHKLYSSIVHKVLSPGS